LDDKLLFSLPVIIFGVLSILFAGWLAKDVFRRDQGTPEMQKVSNAIFAGALAYLKRQYRTIGLLAIVIGFWVVFSSLAPGFLSTFNLFNLGRSLAVDIVIGFSQMVVLATGGMNLAVGSIGVCAVMFTGFLLQDLGLPIPAAMALALVLGTLLGWLNGMAIVKTGVNSFIITLASASLYLGAMLILTKAVPYSELPAAVGAFGTGVAAWAAGGINAKTLRNSIYGTAIATGMIFMIVLGAGLYNTFLALSQLPQELAQWVIGLGMSPWLVLTTVLVVYLLLGCVMDSLSMILLTIPIFFPMIMGLDFGMNPEETAIWFGILVLIVVEVGLITPPVGMNLFVINSMAKDTPITQTYRGVTPFVVSDLVRTAILAAFPVITLVALRMTS